MKTYNIIIKVLAAAMALTALASCQEKLRFNFTKGEEVRFSASTAGNGIDTKAAYSGDVTGTTTKLERIDWQTGDMIRIYCAQASEPESHFADYIVNAVEEGSGAVSKAKIQQWGLEDKGLRWGDISAEHKFYAVYPSPINVDRQVVRTEDVFPGTTSGKETTMTGSIPAIQKPVSLNKGAVATEPNFTAVADLSSEYMVAYASVAAGEQTVDESVFLQFKPIVTAIEFTITNGFTTDGKLNIKSIELEAASSSIAGTFTADLTGLDAAGTKYPTCTSTGTGMSITMDFTDIPGYDYSENEEISGSKKYIKLTKGQSLRFTVFLKPNYNSETPAKPVDIDDITFRINKAEGTWMSTRLGYTDGSGVVFPTHKKSFVTGLIVPEGAQWTVKYAPGVDPWNPGGGDIDPIPEFSGNPIVTSWNTGIDKGLSLKPKEIDFIDLGLPSGTLWADRNIGAKSIMDEPACCGDYYAWSKTETYYEQASSNPPIDVEWKDAYSKGYVQDYGFPYEKYNDTDGLKKLEPIDDVANVVLGGGAQIPSVAQWNELLENCFIVKTINAGYGYVTLTSKINGASIILPAGGFYIGKENTNYGNFGVYYMTSELNTAADLSQVYALHCGASEDLACRLYSRFAGFPVRAVKPKPVPAGFVDLGLSVYWASENLPGYYQFGATTQAVSNTWATTPYYVSEDDGEYVFSRYNTVGNTLEPSDDAAAAAEKGRVPSVEEWDELRTSCTWTWNGSGFTVSSSNGNSITLPANGNFGSYVGELGNYWANEVGGTHNYDAHILYFGTDEQPHVVSTSWNNRKEAFGIRPVHD